MLIFMIIMIITHLVKNMREAAEVAKQKQQQEQREIDAEIENMVTISRTKTPKPPKVPKQRPLVRQPLSDSFGPAATTASTSAPKRQALAKKLAPQGEGQRFEADPGTLDASQIVAPTIDPTVKPELDSITGIYEEGAQTARRTGATLNLNIADIFAKPEGIIQAVILAEILNRPPRFHESRERTFD